MHPSEPRWLRVEAVAALTVLWATFQRLDLPATLDRHFPAPPPWKGPLTPGEVLAVWLLFLVSQGDHCLNHVEPSVAQHQTGKEDAARFSSDPGAAAPGGVDRRHHRPLDPAPELVV